MEGSLGMRHSLFRPCVHIHIGCAFHLIYVPVQHLFKNIPLLLNTENCVWLVPVVGPYPQCTYQQSDCQGIVCTTVFGYVEKVTLSLDNLCADPLSVELTAETSDDVWFRQTFTESTTQFDYGFFTMQRSATQLNFSVSTLAVSTIYIHTHVHTCMYMYLVQ